MHIKNIKIGVRLGLAFSTVLLLAVVLTAVGMVHLQQVVGATDDMDIAIRKMRLADRWLAGSRVNRALSEARLRATDAEDLAALNAKMQENSAEISRVKEELESLITLPQGKAMLAQIARQREVYTGIRKEVFAMKDGGAADPVQIRQAVKQKMNPALAAYDGLVNQLSERQKKLSDEAKHHIAATAAAGRLLLAVVGAVALALGAALAWYLTRSITRPLREAVDLANAVAKGDLTTRVEASGRDETGELMAALKTMNTNLNALVTRVRGGADVIAATAVQVAAGNIDLSSRTEQQASALEESASSMEELTGTVRQNAENAGEGNRMAESASSIATRGGEVVSQVVETMGAINDSARKIVDIIAVIDGIAFQTNILALNAAVEAARAGEQGRGFAVVAGEVRTLAQRSAAAAKEIKALIDDSVEKVGTGSRLVDEAGATMKEVVESVQRVTAIMAEIASASQEQSAGIHQVSQAIMQMDQVTQQNAALVEEAAAATESMQDQARSLAEAVSVFKLDGAGAPGPAPAAGLRKAVAPKPQRALPAGRPAGVAASAAAEGWEAF